MQHRKLVLALLAILAFSIYLNRAYARIYHTIGAAGLESPKSAETYEIGNASSASVRIVYAAIGDSLTAGVGVSRYEDSYPYVLAVKLASEKDSAISLKASAVPGATTSDVLQTFLPQALASKPNVVTLLIGVNDIHGLMSKSTFQKNYEAILRELTTKTSSKIYVVSIPRIGADELLWWPYRWLFDWRTREFNTVIQKLARTYNVTYVDVYTPTAALFATSGTHYTADLFHPSVSGYARWAQILYDSLR